MLDFGNVIAKSLRIITLLSVISLRFTFGAALQ